MKVLLVTLTLLGTPASAQAVRQADMENLSEAARLAEYHRLSGELHRYAERQTWPAVEQAYLGCIATGADLKFSDHFHAAHAAQARGDMKAVRDRLGAALEVGGGEERDLIDWLFAIDTTYSAVTIEGYIGAELVPERRPFDPVQSRSIDFAIATLKEKGRFEGILPRGAYHVDSTLVDIRMGKGAAEVTVREPTGRKAQKRKKQQKRKRERGQSRR